MSDEKVSRGRRGLFGLLGRGEAKAEAPRPAPPSPPPPRPGADGFTLDRFYRNRQPGGDSIPAFAVTAQAAAETSKVGVPELVSRVAPPSPAEARPAPWKPPAAKAPGDGENVAMVRTSVCLAHMGSFCSVCSEHCPEEGAIKVELGRPTVDAQKCTGCGRCFMVCPAPINALMLVRRPPRPATT